MGKFVTLLAGIACLVVFAPMFLTGFAEARHGNSVRRCLHRGAGGIPAAAEALNAGPVRVGPIRMPHLAHYSTAL